MRFFFSIGLLSSLILISCSKPPTTNTQPQFVDAKEVQSILVAHTPTDSEVCISEIDRLGGKILYKGSAGLLMTDLSKEALSASRCQATLSSNEVEKLPQRATSSRPELPKLSTLLKLLPAEEIGARSFINKHPKFDGRNVTIAVLDTGVDLDHPILKKTPNGEIKVIDSQDFSGEGFLKMTPVTVDPNEVFVSPEGELFSVEGIFGTEYRFGLFKGSTIALRRAVGEPDKFTDVGVLIYKNDRNHWVGRIDTNDDLTFADEVELSNYAESKQFTKLGEQQTLTTVLNISADGSATSLVFDDGGHGTHVAGIAAGYEKDGLQGVAPGAKIISGKIGDNRLAGGSTTTASKLLGIDFAVRSGAQVVNISYGISAGSNIGTSAIDQYVDNVAREHGTLFAISAGNSGPGLLTIGTPAGADRALTVGAYVSKYTAQNNYGFVGVENNNVWFFSSVGPRRGGGFKPSIIAPGSALSSLPHWTPGFETYRGTSMAAPQVAGGLALLVSAALQSELPSDRASVTQAVYGSAQVQKNLTLIQQGHGLMQVPAAFKFLKDLKGQTPVEYKLAVNSPAAPGGKGSGIYVRSAVMPSNIFIVNVTPDFPTMEVGAIPPLFLKTYKLVPSAKWIKTPESFWLNTSGRRSFRVVLDSSVLKKPGLFSEKITAIDEQTGKVAFVVPVTVVSPVRLDLNNGHTFETHYKIKVGETKRLFIDVPPGTTSAQIDLLSDGQRVWGQLLGADGREVKLLIPSNNKDPQPPVFEQSNILRPGVYEIDLTAPSYNARPAEVSLKVKLFSLTSAIGAPSLEHAFEVEVQNNFGPIHLTPKLNVPYIQRSTIETIEGSKKEIPFEFTENDASLFKSVSFDFMTSKSVYDLMTDYPYRVFSQQGELLDSGGMDLTGHIELQNLPFGSSYIELQGAFTKEAPDKWNVKMVERRHFKEAITLRTDPGFHLELGQSHLVGVDTSKLSESTFPAYRFCPVMSLEDPNGRKVQDINLCD